jgi:outer membrane protein assembly factor BamB
MSEDFVTRLERELTRAERLQEGGGRLRRRVAWLRAWRLVPAAGVAAAVAAVVAALTGVLALTHGDTNRVAGHRPAVVARTWLGQDPVDRCSAACDTIGSFPVLASGLGSGWAGGTEHHEVIRLSADGRRVVARIGVGRWPSGIVATADAVWVLVNPSDATSSLVRIDPARDRVTARIPVPRVSTVPTLVGDDRVLWVLGEEQGVRVDPRRGAVAGRVSWGFGGVYAKSFGLAGDDLWARAEDGRLLRFDAHTGARTGRADGPPGIANLAVIPGTGVVVAGEDGTLTRIDAPSGRVRWSARPAAGAGAPSAGSGRTQGTITISGGTVWTLVEDSLRATEALAAVDLATGRTLTATALKDPGAGWLQPVGDDLWYLAPQGYAVVVRPTAPIDHK